MVSRKETCCYGYGQKIKGAAHIKAPYSISDFTGHRAFSESYPGIGARRTQSVAGNAFPVMRFSWHFAAGIAV